MDWFSRRVLAWLLSTGMEAAFCVEALQEAMDRDGTLEIFNTDQGVQFTSADFIAELASRSVRISLDGKGRYLDNIFIERLWRSLKYEGVFLKAYASVRDARAGIGSWSMLYNDIRRHPLLGYPTPHEVFEAPEAGGDVYNASTLTHSGKYSAQINLGSHPVEGRCFGRRRSMERQPNCRSDKHRLLYRHAGSSTVGGKRRGVCVDFETLSSLGQKAHLRWCGRSQGDRAGLFGATPGTRQMDAASAGRQGRTTEHR